MYSWWGGAENFAFSQGMARVSPDIFSTPARYEQLLAARAAGEMALDHSGAPLDETKNGYSRRSGAG